MQIKDNPSGARYGKTLVGDHIIGGQLVSPGGEERFLSRNPAYQPDIVGDFPMGSPATVEAACQAARKAFQSWKHTPAPVRGQIIGRVTQILIEKKEMLSRLVTREIGKPLRESRGEVQEAIDTAVFFQGEGRRLYGQTVPSEMRRKELMTYRRPLGVCGMITAGNFPFAVPSWKIIPALICGNTIVWKPSEDAPAIAYAFANVWREAGLPDGVLNVVFGTGAATGQALVDAIDKGLVQKISFTGSTAVGRRIGEVAGRNLQIPSLELGGKNPLVVMPDVDMETAVTAAIWSAYGTGGQRCTSLGNLILHKDIADKFLAKFIDKAKSLTIGDPSAHEDITYGPLIADRFVKNYLAHHDMASKSAKAKCILKGERIVKGSEPAGFKGDAENGLYVTPTIYDNVAIEELLAQTETFGPTVNVIRVSDFDEAMRAANGTPYGLSSGIYTNDPAQRLRFKNEINAGMSSINNSTTGAEAHLPFGGCGWSGNGTRESGMWVVDAYTRWHAVNVDDSGGLQLAQIETEEVAAAKSDNLDALVSMK